MKLPGLLMVAAALCLARPAAAASALEDVLAGDAAVAARSVEAGQQAGFLEVLADGSGLFRPEFPEVMHRNAAIVDGDVPGRQAGLNQLMNRVGESNAGVVGKTRTLSLENHPVPSSFGDYPLFGFHPNVFERWV